MSDHVDHQALECMDLVRERVSLTEVLDFYGADVNQSGFGDCPLCGRSRSVVVNEGSGQWFCRSSLCAGRGGDVFTVVREREQLHFSKAVRFVIDTFGVAVW